MVQFIKKRRLTSLIIAFLAVGIFATVAYAAYNERRKTIFHEQVRVKDKIILEEDVEFGTEADITYEAGRRVLYPRNYMDNSQLAIWSGGTCFTADTPAVAGGTNYAVPDGWNIPSLSSYTGVTRIDVSTIAPVSSVTPPSIHSMYVATWDATTGPGTTKYVCYPDSGVSTAAWWYNKFAGKRVVFGAWVNRDIDYAVSAGVTTNFIRPFIHIGQNYKASEENFTFGNYIENGGWTLSTVEYDVPAAISSTSAFEVGFAMNPTVLAPPGGSSTGDSCYVVAPFLLIDPLRKEYVARPDEVVFFDIGLNVWSGGSIFGATAAGNPTSLDISADVGWNGIVPDDAKAIYANIGGSFAGVLDADYLYLYGNSDASGVTISAEVAAIKSIFHPVWIPISSTGTINIENTNIVTGVSLSVTAAKIR